MDAKEEEESGRGYGFLTAREGREEGTTASRHRDVASRC